MADSHPAPTAPPTKPGRIGRPAARPASRWAVVSLVCAIVGLLITPFALAGIVVGVIGLRRLAAPDSKRGGRGVAIAGICTGAAGLLIAPVYAVMAWSIYSAIDNAGRIEAIQDLRALHARAVTFSDANGRYPVHVAELLTASKGSFAVHRHVRNHGGVAGPDVLVAGYDFSTYDGSARSLRAVSSALEQIDESEPFYTFGDCGFVRLDVSRSNPDVVFAWWPEPDSDLVHVIMDDGSMRAIDRADWHLLWAVDRTIRAADELPALPPDPPEP